MRTETTLPTKMTTRILKCVCGAELEVRAATESDLYATAKASDWEIIGCIKPGQTIGALCPACEFAESSIREIERSLSQRH